ncbi:MAG: FAD/NAD(P)-binding oxidoreductase [Thermoanaerobaculia bacterium]
MPEPLRARVVVVGAGPAGIAAAAVAAEVGSSVLLLDEAPSPGGQIWRSGSRSRLPSTARRWLDRLHRSGARVVSEATVIDAEFPPHLIVDRRGRRLDVQADCVILATGSRELFLPFPGWTLPGVLGVGGAQALSKTGVSFRDRRVVIAGSGPLLLPVAAALVRDGARVITVAEQASRQSVMAFALGLWRQPAKLLEAGRLRAAFARSPYRTGVWVERAQGDGTVSSVTLTDGSNSWIEACDILCSSYGLVPNVELAVWLGCSLHGGAVEVDEDQVTSVGSVFCVGEPTGIGGCDLALVEGQIAGLVAAGVGSRSAGLRRQRAALRRIASRMEKSFRPRGELLHALEGATTVCRCEDVAWDRLEAVTSLRQAKLYTRVGMGACQGRVCGAALQLLKGWRADRVRSPLKPCRVGEMLVEKSSGEAT